LFWKGGLAVTPFDPTMSQSRIEAMSPEDIPHNVALSQSVGWKDVEGEWRVLHAAGDVRGVRLAGRVVAQGVLGDYGNSATLAKMVVAAELQRQGLGARLLDGFLEQADARGIPVGLCATDLGRPLYESRGFRVSGELMILFGAVAGIARPGSVVPLSNAERAVELDARFSGCDRRRMLQARFREATVALELAGQSGFAFASAQGDHLLVGPVLAETEQGARELLLALLASSGQRARIDVPLQHVELRRWLVGLGLAEVSQRVEMVRGATGVPWQVPHRYALASQAWG
jgi:GNAT superfamily N-acetyltransferase